MDGRNPAPPKKPWIGDSPVNANKQWFHGAGFCPSTVSFRWVSERNGASEDFASVRELARSP